MKFTTPEERIERKLFCIGLHSFIQKVSRYVMHQLMASHFDSVVPTCTPYPHHVNPFPFNSQMKKVNVNLKNSFKGCLSISYYLIFGQVPFLANRLHRSTSFSTEKSSLIAISFSLLCPKHKPHLKSICSRSLDNAFEAC